MKNGTRRRLDKDDGAAGHPGVNACVTEPVRTELGLVRGRITGNDPMIYVYRGIPYAAPPTGNLRWKPPQPAASWEGVLDCFSFKACGPELDKKRLSSHMAEDCLYLNVWTPTQSPGDRLPVMVWLRGGGRGESLASRGMVIVSFDYRKGLFGFLAHPLLSRESPMGLSGNYGLLDQLEALKWIRRNIEAFGGNPDCITIFGESAGGNSVCGLMVNPLAEGFFQRAIVESGGPMGIRYVLPWCNILMEEALETGERLASLLGYDKEQNALEAMRCAKLEDLHDATGSVMGPFNRGLQFEPIIDGWLIPRDREHLFASGLQLDVPIIVGFNADEGSLFAQGMTDEEFRGWIYRMCYDCAGELLALFPAEKPEDVIPAFTRLFTIMAFAYPARLVADSMMSKSSNAYLYHFARVPELKKAKARGAYHGLEVPYIFGAISEKEGFGKEDFAISSLMMSYWSNFALTGDPNSSELPYWPPYESATDRYIEFGGEVIVKSGLHKNICDMMKIF